MLGEHLTDDRGELRRAGRLPKLLPRWLAGLLGLMMAAGIAAFLILLGQDETTRAWQIFLVNFLYWPGMAVAGVAWAAIFEVTRACWPSEVRRLAETCAAYLPLAFMLFLATWLGRFTLFPWARQPNPAIEAWLNLPFLYGRETVGLLLLFGISLLFVYRPGRALQKLGVLLLIIYGVVYTIFSWDFAMSIQPGWFSTMFGALFFVENLYLGLAAVTVLTVLAGRRDDWNSGLGPAIFNNLGKLLLAFSLLWIYLFGAQYLVIWYGNLPHEISFILARTESDSWKMLAFVMLVLLFVTPFLVLLSPAARKSPQILLAMAVAILAGMWLERYLLVVPALSPGSQFSLNWQELTITAGFFASFALAYLFSLARIPRSVRSRDDAASR